MSELRAETGPCVHDLVTARAASFPDRLALIHSEGQLTYRQLDERAARLAHRLIELGVTPDAPVGVFLERSADFVITMLAVLKAGANYVPLDPNYPAPRLALMLERFADPYVITRSALADRVPAGGARVLRLEALTDEAASSPARPLPAVHPDNLAYTMFTSGSTGVPKAVQITHRGIVRLVQDTTVRFDESEIVLHLSSTSFDAATFEIWGALTNGSRLVIGPPGPASVVEVGTLLRDHAITTAFLTTGLFHLMVDERLEDLGGVRQLVTGGDVLSSSRAERVRAAHPSCRLINAYGPTEVTSFTTTHHVREVAAEAFGVPIGRPILRTVVRLLDDDLQPVPVGEPGRLYAGGDGLARGYLGDPAFTATRFVPDPWVAGQRMYDTGDRARELPDGSLEFLGRADQQIKRRGFRIEPSEIEEALRRDPDLRDAAVVPEGSGAEERILVAVLLAAPTRTTQGDLVHGVRERLRDQLPSYLIPDQWAVLESFPLNPNGKVDRKSLAAAAADRLELTDPDVAEAGLVGTVEQAVAEIWQELFGLDRVDRDDDFFELGGHSLLASRMVSRIRSGLGVELPLATIFDCPTVAEVAALVEQG